MVFNSIMLDEQLINCKYLIIYELADLHLYQLYLGQRRIVVEHAIRGIKRFHIAQHACRLSGYWVRGKILNICTGIHNFRVRSPLREYSCHQEFQLSCSAL